MRLANIKNNRDKENGSAIIWILVAISLFAALNFAFNSGSRTSTSFLSDAEAEAYAKQIIQYGNEVKAAVKRLQLRGCSDTEISFENDVVSGYTNPNSPADKSCHVFDIAGGGLSWKDAPDHINMGLASPNDYGQYKFTARGASGGLNIQGHGTNANPDLYFYIRGRINTGHKTQKNFINICQKINKALDIPEYPANDFNMPRGGRTGDLFVGAYDDGSASLSLPEVADLKQYCSNENTGYFNYSQILIAR